MAISRVHVGALLVTLLCASALPAAGTPQAGSEPDGTETPSEALHQLRVALAAGGRERQAETAKPFLASAKKTNLPPDEEIALGELYFLALMPQPADAIFSRYLDRRDALGRVSWHRHQQILFRARDLHDEAERGIAEYRKRFAPSAEDLTHTAAMLSNQATRYAEKGDHAKVAALILEDVQALPKELPLRSFRLLATRYESFVAVGRAAEARALLEAHRHALQARIATHGNGLAAASELAGKQPPHKKGMLHTDVDIMLANDAADFSPDRFATQLAIDRVKELDELLAKMRD